ncbi:hypothetical protein D9613_006907 [Agrocybe pediades]|uniref:Uncharacterized protein n=1 Tax=Agrocybe pediades TaxID=84607 RepID=A0A8H4VI00_9AGAR|nr:hypothetical protein D9613_006907 [Agrocybe pediades]
MYSTGLYVVSQLVMPEAVSKYAIGATAKAAGSPQGAITVLPVVFVDWSSTTIVHGLLLLVPVTFIICVLPIVKTLSDHIQLAITISRGDDWANRVWWQWYGSWILCAGPFGRWIVGLVLGYIVMENSRASEDRVPPGFLVEEPHLRVVLTAGFALLFSTFAVGLLISSIHKVLQGRTTFESLKPRTQRSSHNDYRYDLMAVTPSCQSDQLNECTTLGHVPTGAFTCKGRYSQFLHLAQNKSNDNTEGLFITQWIHSHSLVKCLISVDDFRGRYLHTFGQLRGDDEINDDTIPLFPQPTDGQFPADSPDKQAPLKREPPSEPDHWLQDTSWKVPVKAP